MLVEDVVSTPAQVVQHEVVALLQVGVDLKWVTHVVCERVVRARGGEEVRTSARRSLPLLHMNSW